MKYVNWKYAGKAIAAGLAAGAALLGLVITGNESFVDVTVNEWLFVFGGILATYGFTYNAPANKGVYAEKNRIPGA